MIDSFLHVPKTGGSTLRSVLARQYGLSGILYCEPSGPKWPKGLSVLDFIRNGMLAQDVRLITGHYPLGVHEYARRPVRYISLLRDPLDRELSNYYYAFSYQLHPLRAAIISGELTFDVFLARQQTTPSAGQTHLLSGQYPMHGDALAAASFNMSHSLVAVGVAERFDETLLFFAKQLGWRPPLYVRRNVTKLDEERQAERDARLQNAQQAAMEYLRADYALYGQANVRLNNFVEACGRSFREAYGAYMELQDDLSRFEDADINREYAFGAEAPLPGGLARVQDSAPYRTLERFLEEPLPAPAPRNYVGYVGKVEGQTIIGWATDLWSDSPVVVSAWHEGRIVAQTTADQVREDVKRAGIAAERVGFRMPVPEGVPPAGLQVTFGETPIALRGAVGAK